MQYRRHEIPNIRHKIYHKTFDISSLCHFSIACRGLEKALPTDTRNRSILSRRTSDYYPKRSVTTIVGDFSLATFLSTKDLDLDSWSATAEEHGVWARTQPRTHALSHALSHDALSHALRHALSHSPTHAPTHNHNPSQTGTFTTNAIAGLFWSESL